MLVVPILRMSKMFASFGLYCFHKSPSPGTLKQIFKYYVDIYGLFPVHKPGTQGLGGFLISYTLISCNRLTHDNKKVWFLSVNFQHITSLPYHC